MLKELINAIREQIEIAQNNAGSVEISKRGNLVVTTHPTTDSRFMFNGGAYEYWTSFRPTENGIEQYSCSSSDFDTDELVNIYPVSIKNMARLLDVVTRE